MIHWNVVNWLIEQNFKQFDFLAPGSQRNMSKCCCLLLIQGPMKEGRFTDHMDGLLLAIQPKGGKMAKGFRKI